MGNKIKLKAPSEGEFFIGEYLKSQDISFETEVILNSLKNDVKSHRKVDFYLPKLKIYIEFYGQWNNTKEDRERYRIKKRVYRENNIPCVYLYPENLGIIDYCFSNRLVKVLEKNNLKKELLKYRFKRLYNDRGNLFGFSILFIFMLIYNDYNSEKGTEFAFLLSVGLIYQIYRFFIGYKRFFLKNEYYSNYL
ncbi:hypothetical protein [Tenacibaculum aquimarinum]|uniref:hypothetical protein n=1 Tax=Tenacibaculum aquimarinum TaxID=2910675 RepID=UPI001F0AC7C8|nr:hypothetical protein [Tenacibaculum aquimarinum]MCH3883955.1 hypothetical protein [Tenacibaculum aquimarinum]